MEKLKNKIEIGGLQLKQSLKRGDDQVALTGLGEGQAIEKDKWLLNNNFKASFTEQTQI